MQKLLIATSNLGKLAQYQSQLADLNIELVTTKDLNLGSVDETGTTFEENCLLKARTACRLGFPMIYCVREGKVRLRGAADLHD